MGETVLATKYEKVNQDLILSSDLARDLETDIEDLENDMDEFEVAWNTYVEYNARNKYLLEKPSSSFLKRANIIDKYINILLGRGDHQNWSYVSSRQDIVWQVKIKISTWYKQAGWEIPSQFEPNSAKKVEWYLYEDITQVNTNGSRSQVTASDRQFLNGVSGLNTREDLLNSEVTTSTRLARLESEKSNLSSQNVNTTDSGLGAYLQNTIQGLERRISAKRQAIDDTQRRMVELGLSSFSDHWLFQKLSSSPRFTRYVYNPATFGLQQILDFVRWICRRFVSENTSFRNGVGTIAAISLACSWIFDISNPICIVIRYIASLWMWAVDKVFPPPPPPPRIPSTLLETIQSIWTNSISPNVAFLQSTYDVCIGYFSSGYTAVAMMGAMLVAIIGLILLQKYHQKPLPQQPMNRAIRPRVSRKKVRLQPVTRKRTS